MKVLWQMGNKMERGYFIMIMEISILVIGKIIYFMVKEFIFLVKEKDLKGIWKMVLNKVEGNIII